MKKVVGIGFFSRCSSSFVFWFSWMAKLDVTSGTLSSRPISIFTLENLVKKDYKASLMSLIIAFIIANAILDILPLSSGLVIGAGVLACVGIGFLFPETNKKEV